MKVADLAVGDVVLVRSGSRVPADGTIIEGAAELEESIRVRVDAVGEDTALAGIQRLVAEAQASTSRAQGLADRAAALLFCVAVVFAAVTVIVWSLLGQPASAVTRAVTVLIIGCPTRSACRSPW